MNMHELPMILFTVIAQMCVGAFIILGVIQLFVASKYDSRTTARVIDPALFAIGPVMVLGLAVSMLHMNDITNTFNVIRHWETSWLSREIIFGIAFAGAGFVFAVMQWYKIGTQWLRNIVAFIAAALGIGLVWSMSQIYYSLDAVPAWNHWAVPVHFFGTTLLLGALAVGTAIVVFRTLAYNRSQRPGPPVPIPGKERAYAEAGHATVAAPRETDERKPVRRGLNRTHDARPVTVEEHELSTTIVKWTAIIAAVVGVIILITYPLYVTDLAQGGETARQSASILTGGFFIWRLILLGVSSALLAMFAFKTASSGPSNPRPLAAIISIAFVLAFIGELMGRSLHYDIMNRVGM